MVLFRIQAQFGDERAIAFHFQDYDRRAERAEAEANRLVAALRAAGYEVTITRHDPAFL